MQPVLPGSVPGQRTNAPSACTRLRVDGSADHNAPAIRKAIRMRGRTGTQNLGNDHTQP